MATSPAQVFSSDDRESIHNNDEEIEDTEDERGNGNGIDEEDSGVGGNNVVGGSSDGEDGIDDRDVDDEDDGLDGKEVGEEDDSVNGEEAGEEEDGLDGKEVSEEDDDGEGDADDKFSEMHPVIIILHTRLSISETDAFTVEYTSHARTNIT